MTDNDYDLTDHSKLSFMLGEYLGLQSNKLDKESLQKLHDYVRDILKKLNYIAFVTEKERGNAK